MMGVPGDPGIIPRTVVDVFESIKGTAAAQPDTIFMVRKWDRESKAREKKNRKREIL